MSRLTLIVPDLLSPRGDSILGSLPPTLRQIVEQSTISKIAALPDTETPEALYLGMSPTEGQLRQGPLTVAALGADPPTDSTHFHLSLMAFEDGVGKQISLEIPIEELRAIEAQFERLNTRLLTIVKGTRVDHALVWEARGDLGTTPPPAVDGHPIRLHLPEGDGEPILWRLIDDSINLLSELELNERRIDAGLPPLNMLWPWGQGIRTPVPNLALRRGEPGYVWSSSLRLRGLSRLAGYRHLDGPRSEGINLKIEEIRSAAATHDPLIVVIDLFARLRAEERLDEAEWFLRELDSRLLKPFLKDVEGKSARLAILAPASHDVSDAGERRGLALEWEAQNPIDNSYPFDERSIDERLVPTRDLNALVSASLQPLSPRDGTG